MSEIEPIEFRPRNAGGRVGERPGVGDPSRQTSAQTSTAAPVTVFTRHELNDIFNLYGRMVAAGEWRDYALDMLADKAVFSIFRRTSECPLYRIEKVPRLARKQGAFSILSAGGLVMKRGHDLARVLTVLERKPRLVE